METREAGLRLALVARAVNGVIGEAGAEPRTLFTAMAALADAVAFFLKKRYRGTRRPEAMPEEF